MDSLGYTFTGDFSSHLVIKSAKIVQKVWSFAPKPRLITKLGQISLYNPPATFRVRFVIFL